jgi:nitrogen-specific signal transduction histidine kinase
MPNVVEPTTSQVERENTTVQPLTGFADFIRHLAHELRQPLSAIESIAFYLDLVLPPNATNAREQLAKLQDQAEQSGWIVSNALDFLQATTPSQELVDLSEIVPLPLAAAGTLSEAPAVRVDRAQAERLMRNLLVFFDHAGAAGPIAFDAAADHASGLVVIQASAGAAASTQQIETLFQPFHPNLPPGVGLAMASMVRIAEAHGGWIRTSAGDNRVTIQVALPQA